MRGCQHGQVFVDRVDSPSWAFIRNSFGFAHVVGDLDMQGASALVQWLQEESSMRGRYHIWYSPPPACQSVLDESVFSGMRRRRRIKFALMSDEASGGEADGLQVDTKRVLPLDVSLLKATSGLGLDIGCRFWNSEDDFLSSGFGYAIMESEGIASVCYSACVVDEMAEIDVFTAEAYRGRGYAESVCRAFLLRCRSDRISPSWDCFDYNLPSVKLALGLGFSEIRRYDLYSFNT